MTGKWLTKRQDEYSILNSKHFIGIHGYMLVYSVSSRPSFEMVQVIRDKILNHLVRKRILACDPANVCNCVSNEVCPRRRELNLSPSSLWATRAICVQSSARSALRRVRNSPKRFNAPGPRQVHDTTRTWLEPLSCSLDRSKILRILGRHQKRATANSCRPVQKTSSAACQLPCRCEWFMQGSHLDVDAPGNHIRSSSLAVAVLYISGPICLRQPLCRG